MTTFDTNHNARRTSIEDRLLAVLGSATGILTLGLTWYFYRGFFADGIDWLGLVQPALMIAGGGLALVAATMLVAGHPDGREMLKFAFSFLPFVLAWRLVVLVARMLWEGLAWGIGYVQGHTSVAPFEAVRLTPFNILNIVVIAVVIAVNIARWERSRQG